MKNQTLLSCIAAVLAAVPLSVSAQRGDNAGHVMTPPPADLEIPDPAPRSVEESLASFKIVDGFEVQVVAAEPLIEDPVAAAWDPDGRLWVCEMIGFMPNVDGHGEDVPNGNIVILEDTDLDGRMDKRTVFLDKIVLPRALAFTKDGLLYADQTSLYYVVINEDGTAGAQQVVEARYASEGGGVEHKANGLLYGLDNWYYSAKSSRRFARVGHRFMQTRTEFRGQWGITQDDYGRLLANHNSTFMEYELLPPNASMRNPHFNFNAGNTWSGASRVRTSTAVYPIRVTPGVNRGYQPNVVDHTTWKLKSATAVSGPVIYRGDQYPAEYYNNLFAPEPAGNLLKRIIISDNAAERPTARQAYADYEFLASDDERCRFVNAYVGPDGCVYVLDMYRGILQHKDFVTTFLRNQILERGLDKPIGMGRIYRIVYVGGETRTQVSELIEREAEDAQLDGPEVSSANPNYTGRGFVDFIGLTGESVSWTIEIENAGDYELSFRYSMAAGDRPLDLRVDGQMVKESLSFGSTGSWNNWGYTAPVPVTLAAGDHTFTLTSNGVSGSNVDSLRLRQLDTDAASQGVVRKKVQYTPANPKLGAATSTELVGYLAHPNAWWRETAQRLLVERRDASAVSALQEMATRHDNPLARIHALWTLDGMRELDGATMVSAAQTKDPKVRIQVLRLAEQFGDTEWAKPLVMAIVVYDQDPSWELDLQLALSAGTLAGIDTPEAYDLLLTVLDRRGDDRLFRHAAISGLKGKEAAMIARLDGQADSPVLRQFTGELTGAMVKATESGDLTIGSLLALIDSAQYRDKPEQRLGMLGMLATQAIEQDRDDVLNLLIERMSAEGAAADEQRAILEGFTTAARPGNQPVDLAGKPELFERWEQQPPEALADLIPKLAETFIYEKVVISDEVAVRIERGYMVYLAQCVSCHGAEGEMVEGQGPPLAGSDWVHENQRLVSALLLGGVEGPIVVSKKLYSTQTTPQIASAMPTFAPTLSDQEIADVLTYIRNAFGNRADPVSVEVVAQMRETVALREGRPYSPAELRQIQPMEGEVVSAAAAGPELALVNQTWLDRRSLGLVVLFAAVIVPLVVLLVLTAVMSRASRPAPSVVRSGSSH